MGEKNDLLSAVASDDVVDRVEHLVEYLSCKVFGQAMYRHVTIIQWGLMQVSAPRSGLDGFYDLELHTTLRNPEARRKTNMKGRRNSVRREMK